MPYCICFKRNSKVAVLSFLSTVLHDFIYFILLVRFNNIYNTGKWPVIFKFVVSNSKNTSNRIKVRILPNVASLLVYKEIKAFNITTGRVLKIACYP